jgi:membrane fusion protein (multidrug efflux system)
VYKVQGDSLAVTRVIEVTARVDNLIVVASGIKKGEKIVAQGVGKLRDNTAIKPQLVPFDSIANSLQAVFK